VVPLIQICSGRRKVKLGGGEGTRGRDGGTRCWNFGVPEGISIAYTRSEAGGEICGVGVKFIGNFGEGCRGKKFSGSTRDIPNIGGGLPTNLGTFTRWG